MGLLHGIQAPEGRISAPLGLTRSWLEANSILYHSLFLLCVVACLGGYPPFLPNFPLLAAISSSLSCGRTAFANKPEQQCQFCTSLLGAHNLHLQSEQT